jgi:hypothetical protein
MNRRDFFSICSNVGSTVFSADILQQLSSRYTEEIGRRVQESEADLNDKIRKLGGFVENGLTAVHNKLDRQAFDITATKAHLTFLTTWIFVICLTYGLDLAIRFSLLLISII